jgi:membrane fusion protein (multidrug efflux system)
MPTRSRPARNFLAAALLLIAACSKEAKAPALPPPEIPVVTVTAKDTPLEFDLVAQLRGLEDVEIRARVEGYLETIDYVEGSTVQKGKLLFTIDDQQYIAARWPRPRPPWRPARPSSTRATWT